MNDEMTADIVAVQEILRRWDPIGIEPGVVGPADEYDSYALILVSMVYNGCTLEEITSHLEHLAIETMALGSSSRLTKEQDAAIAAEIVSVVRPDGTSNDGKR